MPSVSKTQKGATAAAAAGKSTLGIPKAVGKQFTAADKKTASAKLAPGLINRT